MDRKMREERERYKDRTCVEYGTVQCKRMGETSEQIPSFSYRVNTLFMCLIEF